MTQYQPEDYIKYRFEKAISTIYEVETLIEKGFFNTAVNRMYYACFYAVGALLIKHGIIVSSHSGSRQKFGSLFVQTGLIDKESGKLYSELFEKRQKGDYNDFFDFDHETVVRLFGPAKKLILRIGELLMEK
jgi:uncharacterized protein (UPF0332 family)